MSDFESRLHEMYDDIETKYHPDVRWWLAEGLNTDATLKKNVQQIHDMGFGAAEFLAMPEPHADSSIYGWGSEEWTNDSKLIVEETTRLGLGFSMTNGAHWATANLPDTYEWGGRPFNPDNKAASKELDYAMILLKAGESFDGKLPEPVHVGGVEGNNADFHGSSGAYTENIFQAVVAAKLTSPRKECGQDYEYRKGTGEGTLDFDSLCDLTARAVASEDGSISLKYTAPADGTYGLFVYWMHGTGQVASPSVSTNYTINYMDRYGIDALKDYWNEVIMTPDLRETIRKNGRGEIYMDSLELLSYGAGGVFWGYDIQEEFRKRRGYEIAKYLPVLTTDGARVTGRKPIYYDYTDVSAQEKIDKIHNDFYNLMSEMYVQNVLIPLADWLHSLGMTLRSEPSYGTNFEISMPGKAIDGIETESFSEVSDVDLFRGQSGAANMYGHLFSSETGAVKGYNYYFTMDSWTCLCYLQFSEGVNRTVFHGYSAIEGSVEDTKWPGHEGMYARFSERFSCRQPASEHYPQWTKMLGRCQKAMRQGTAVKDLAILRTDYQYINYGIPEELGYYENNFMMNDLAYFWKDLSLQRAGYTYDYFSPILLEDESNVSWTSQLLQPSGASYKAILVYQEDIELSAAKKLLEIAKDGLPVLFVNNNSEMKNYVEPDKKHGKAASKSKYLMDSDEAIGEVVSQIKALPNVKEADSPAQVPEILKTLGLEPRVSYDRPQHNILTASRLDRENQIFYSFVYAFKYMVQKDAPAQTFTVTFEKGGIPYIIDSWNGNITKVGCYEIRDGKTSVQVTLKNGEAVLFALDLTGKEGRHAVSTNGCRVRENGGEPELCVMKSGEYETVMNDGSVVRSSITVPEEIAIPSWKVEIEDWNEGELVINTEEKFGHVTKEAYFTTKKTPLTFEIKGSLPAWKDLPATPEQLHTLSGGVQQMKEVSGIGRYEAVFELPESFESGAMLSLESSCGGQVIAWINDNEVAVPNRSLKVDISSFVKAGRNTLKLEVDSSLTNRMLQRGYIEEESLWTEEFPGVQNYGIVGTVKILPYGTAKL